MGSVKAALSVVIGIFISGLTHYGIGAGRLYGRWDTVVELSDDPSFFWIVAAVYYGFGLTMITYGSVYILTGTAIFPDLKENSWFGYVLVLMVVFLGMILWKLLPTVYR